MSSGRHYENGSLNMSVNSIASVMRSVEQQVQAALALARPLEPLALTLGDAHGCVLAADVKAAYPVPAFPTATVDGYAVNAALTTGVGHRAGSGATGRSFDVVDWLRPGFTTDQPVSGSEAVYLTAGTMVPASYTAVVGAGIEPPEQNTGRFAHRVIDIRDSVKAGSGIALAGSLADRDDVVLRAGTVLTDRAIAAAAAVGRSRVSAHPQPRVVIMTVGDHLIETGQELVDGLVHDATSAMLLSATRAAGAIAFRGGPVQRDPAALAVALEDQCVRADLIVILSAVEDDDSIEDVVVQALRACGEPEIDFARISPGTRIGLTTAGPDAVPVVTMDAALLSAFVGFEVIVRPMIAAMAGRRDVFRNTERAVLDSTLTAGPTASAFLPSQTVTDPLTGELRVTPMRESPQSASLWLYRADSIMIIPADVTSLLEGDAVTIVRLSQS